MQLTIPLKNLASQRPTTLKPGTFFYTAQAAGESPLYRLRVDPDNPDYAAAFLDLNEPNRFRLTLVRGGDTERAFPILMGDLFVKFDPSQALSDGVRPGNLWVTDDGTWIACEVVNPLGRRAAWINLGTWKAATDCPNGAFCRFLNWSLVSRAPDGVETTVIDGTETK